MRFFDFLMVVYKFAYYRSRFDGEEASQRQSRMYTWFLVKDYGCLDLVPCLFRKVAVSDLVLESNYHSCRILQISSCLLKWRQAFKGL